MIYLDNNATTPIAPEALEAMLQDYTHIPLNPSSVHQFGQKAKGLLLGARADIATTLGVKANQIFFTSGGTESLNLLLQSFKPDSGEVLTTEIEHPAVYETLGAMQLDIRYIDCGFFGAPTPTQLKESINEKTKLIVLSAVNSETGVKLDLKGIATVAHEHNIPLIIDGVALLGKELFSIPPGVSGVGFSSHKLHGPKGVGFVYVERPNRLKPLFHGGAQQMGKRSGTENLGGILGMAKAISLLNDVLPNATQKMQEMRDYFEAKLMEMGNVEINGEGPRVANTSNLYFQGIDAETMLMQLDQAGVAASHGSACASGALEPSRILQKMGYSRERARSSLRFSLSRMTTMEEIEQAINLIKS